MRDFLIACSIAFVVGLSAWACAGAGPSMSLSKEAFLNYPDKEGARPTKKVAIEMLEAALKLLKENKS